MGHAYGTLRAKTHGYYIGRSYRAFCSEHRIL